jgi:hypothetical protein
MSILAVKVFAAHLGLLSRALKSRFRLRMRLEHVAQVNGHARLHDLP